MYKILLIEDDKSLSSLVRSSLEKYGYEVFEVSDFRNIEIQFEEVSADLILLDLNLPYYDGFYICKSIRKKFNTPIIVLSARTGDMDQIMAFEIGADDYITKPFKVEILLYKITATFRRIYGEYSKHEVTTNKSDLYLDEGTFKMHYKGKSLELTKNEFKLLKRFINYENTILAREELLEELWDDITFVDDNTLTVNITRIKNKLSDLGLSGVIKTKRGVGYMFDSSLIGEKNNE